MPLGPQPRRARGTVGHPYSALNLRLVLAGVGLVSCAILTVLLVLLDWYVAAAVTGVLAVVAVVDLSVIQIRRRRRRRIEPWRHSLFE